MKTGTKKVMTGVLAAVFILAVAAAAVFLPSKPIIEQSNNPRVSSISATVGRDGKSFDYDLSDTEIPGELNDALISMLRNAEMRASLFPPPQIYTILDDSVYLSIRMSLDSGSIRVNLCTNPEYSYAQSADKHYRIVNHKQLYQDVHALLAGVIPV